jgi:molecular chaperone GrpE
MMEKDPIKVKVKTDDSDTQESTAPEEDSVESAPEKTLPETPEEKIEKAEADVAAAHDRFLRASAELENYKKRTQKEMADFKRYANTSLVKELLGVVDNLERAVESSNESDEKAQLSEGLNLTLKELLKVLKSFHVTPIDSLGQAFDPCFHQAMMQEETSDHVDNMVLRELQKGYMIHDRLLRPAMVIVSKAVNASNGNNREDDNE